MPTCASCGGTRSNPSKSLCWKCYTSTPQRIIRFEQYFKKGSPDECWNWVGIYHEASGYGFCNSDYAHRLSYTLYVGDIPKGKVVRHSCDNKKCVNPGHLLLGTQMDNVHDTVSRRRISCGVSRWNAKLSPEKVDEMKTLYASGNYTQSQLSEVFGVSSKRINRVLAGKGWKNAC